MMTFEEMIKTVIENQHIILEQDLKAGSPLCYLDADGKFVIRYPDGFVETYDQPCLPKKEHCRHA